METRPSIPTHDQNSYRSVMGGHHNTTRTVHYEPTGFITFCTLRSIGQKPLTPQWSPQLRCTSSERQPTPSGPTPEHYDEDKDRLTPGTSELAAPLQLTSQREIPNLDLLLSCDPPDIQAHEGCCSHRNPRSGRYTTPSLPFLILLSDKCGTMER